MLLFKVISLSQTLFLKNPTTYVIYPLSKTEIKLLGNILFIILFLFYFLFEQVLVQMILVYRPRKSLFICLGQHVVYTLDEIAFTPFE